MCDTYSGHCEHATKIAHPYILDLNSEKWINLDGSTQKPKKREEPKMEKMSDWPSVDRPISVNAAQITRKRGGEEDGNRK